jgi:hypothetical protein
LAPYVSTKAIAGLGLTADDRDVGAGRAARAHRRDLLSELWGNLISANYRYHPGLRIADGSQRVKDPLTIHHSSGNCLEVSLMFTAMCLRVGLRAYPVVLRDDRWGSDDHAVVLVDLGMSADDARPAIPELCVELDGSEKLTERHVYRRCPDLEDALPADTVVVDVVQSLVSNAQVSQATFAQACAAGARLLLDTRGHATVRVVDVVALHADGYPELGKQSDDDRPAIYPSLPPLPPYVDYPSRADLIDRLAGLRGLVVLCGPSGVGKSTLAARLAQNADDGSGWFLNASSTTTLAAALATAELAERGDVLPGPLEPNDVSSNASAARTRLRRATGSWVVVLDNADLEPGQLNGLPEVDGTRGQLLLVTTTNSAWEQRADHFVRLDQLRDEEVSATLGEDVGAAVIHALAGRPLLMEASRRFQQTTGRQWWTQIEPGTADDAPHHLWAVVDTELEERPVGATARAVARAMAWLPPVAVGIGVLESAVSGPEVVEAVDLLHDLGVLTRRSGTVQMHRLLRKAILTDRNAASEDHHAVVGALLRTETVRSFLALVPDLRSLGNMREIVGANPVRLHALGALVERHDSELASKWYTDVLKIVRKDDDLDYDDTERRIVVDSLRGQCRWILRDGEKPPVDRRLQLDLGITKAARAVTLAAGRAAWEDRLAASRAEAMLGLLLRARSNNRGTGDNRIEPDPDRARELLDRAAHYLRHSASERKVLYQERGIDLNQAADVDRSEFNLAGLGVDLAQLNRERADAHLKEADEVYRRVGDLRRARYQSDEFDEVVTCRHGQALVAYYRAVLLNGTAMRKYALLRDAAGLAHDAAVNRATAAGPDDDANTTKSVLLQVKVALARFVLGDPSKHTLPHDIEQFEREREDLVQTIITTDLPEDRN